MNEGLIPKRYAKALYKFALEKGADKGLYSLMGNLVKSFADNPALNPAVSNPFIDDEKKIELLKTAAGDKTNEVFTDFLKLLQQNKRLEMADAIARAYCDIYRKENKIFRVTIVSAQPLDTAESMRLKKIIESHLNGGTAEFTMATDPDLIGGFTVDIDNERLDASVKNELKQLRLKLLGQD